MSGRVTCKSGKLVPLIKNRCLLRCYSVGTQTERSVKEIPGPKPLPFLGTFPKHRPGGELHAKNCIELGLRLHNKYGPIVLEKIMPGFNTIHLYHPEDIEKVFRSEGKHPWRIPTDFTVMYRKEKGITAGLANINGEEWYRYRKGLQQYMLRPLSVAAYIPAQEPVATDLVTRIRRLRDNNNEMTDFTNELNMWSLESIGIVCFNTRVGAMRADLQASPETQEFIKAVRGTFEQTKRIFNSLPLYKIYRTKEYKEYSRCMDILWRTTVEKAEQTLEKAKTGTTEIVAKENNLLLEVLEIPTLKRDEALSIMNDLFFAGVETTAHSLTNTLYLLAINPEVQEKLRQEIDEHLPSEEPMTEEAFNRTKYLKAVVKEGHRMMPVVPGTVRKLEKDIVLQGYRIPAGYIFFLESHIASRLPHYYDDPEVFRPERWLRENKASEPHPFSVLPFGFGPRMCVGKRFAEQEIFIAITKLLQQFKIEYHHEPMGLITQLVNIPDKPFRPRFIDRT